MVGIDLPFYSKFSQTRKPLAPFSKLIKYHKMTGCISSYCMCGSLIMIEKNFLAKYVLQSDGKVFDISQKKKKLLVSRKRSYQSSPVKIHIKF